MFSTTNAQGTTSNQVLLFRNDCSKTKILLFDFYQEKLDLKMMMSDPFCNSDMNLFSKLTIKMRWGKKRYTKGFSGKFEHVGTLGKGIMSMVPMDVKISYHHNCILVANFHNACIHVFELKSKQLKYSVSTPARFPTSICIEENYNDNVNIMMDAILMFCHQNHCLYKYDLEKYLLKDNRGLAIWKSTDIARTMSVTMRPNSKQIFCVDMDARSVKILDSRSGITIHCISLEQSSSPFSLAFVNDFQFVLSTDINLKIFKMSVSHEWKCVKTLGKKGDNRGEFDCAQSIIFDKKSQFLIVNDRTNFRIQIVTLEGECLASFGSFSMIMIDGRSGI
ncbi:hypothetical protein C9374_012417 [Naegleria lovaniensis]|uniref:Uncharacterized protein n=1 Tax=Naegleria lovaniensis TaxID=51637 RepID=A0AA88GWD8_NAELO|nr:uncharacterized protein C9374_012417 [Naegleria lovaniensis]KAG2392165.1 hypothetical protein C9374_012417 [Naegleria lovaniensis]